MIQWRSVSALFTDRRASLQREHRLSEAYRAVFQGSPSREDQEMVLADLAHHSGFAMVSLPETSDAELRHNEGKRHLFSRIRSYMNLSDRDALALENAARREAAMFQSVAYETQAQ